MVHKLKKLVQRSYSLFNLGLVNAYKPSFAKYGKKAEGFLPLFLIHLYVITPFPFPDQLILNLLPYYPLKYGDVIYGWPLS